MKADSLRDKIDPLSGVDDMNGVLIGLALWLLIIIAAPLIVLVLAGALLSIETPIVAALGLLLALIRFTGLIPWTVVLVDQVTGEEQREPYDQQHVMVMASTAASQPRGWASPATACPAAVSTAHSSR